MCRPAGSGARSSGPAVGSTRALPGSCGKQSCCRSQGLSSSPSSGGAALPEHEKQRRVAAALLRLVRLRAGTPYQSYRPPRLGLTPVPSPRDYYCMSTTPAKKPESQSSELQPATCKRCGQKAVFCFNDLNPTTGHGLLLYLCDVHGREYLESLPRKRAGRETEGREKAAFSD